MKAQKAMVPVLATLILLGMAGNALAGGGTTVEAGICAGGNTITQPGQTVTTPAIFRNIPGQRVEVGEMTLNLGDRQVTVHGYRVESPDHLTVPSYQVRIGEHSFYVPQTCLDLYLHVEGGVRTPGFRRTLPGGSVSTPDLHYSSDDVVIEEAGLTVTGPKVEVQSMTIEAQARTIEVVSQEIQVPDGHYQIKLNPGQ